MTMTRSDGRAAAELRPTKMTPSFTMHAEGSVLIEAGTHARHLHGERRGSRAALSSQHGKGLGHGGIRHAAARDVHAHAARGDGRQGRRPHPGDPAADRPLAAVGHRLNELGERTVWIDCDVIQADGGTRTAAITGGFVALVLALQRMRAAGRSSRCRSSITSPPRASASSDGTPLLDLAYDEDSKAEVDMNVVKTGDGRFIEVQGTAEGPPFERPRARRPAGARRRRDPRARRAAARRSSATSADDRPRSPRTTLLVATTNPGKLREIAGILDGAAHRAADPARLSRTSRSRKRPGTRSPRTRGSRPSTTRRRPAAERRGRFRAEIEALDNAPGVHSARWQGSDYAVKFRKIQELLHERGRHSAARRDSCATSPSRARDRSCSRARGSCAARRPPSRAATNGFGYDPIFFYPPLGRTLAELTTPKRPPSATAAGVRGAQGVSARAPGRRPALAGRFQPFAGRHPSNRRRHEDTCACRCHSSSLPSRCPSGRCADGAPQTGTWTARLQDTWTRNNGERWVSFQLEQDDEPPLRDVDPYRGSRGSRRARRQLDQPGTVRFSVRRDAGESISKGRSRPGAGPGPIGSRRTPTTSRRWPGRAIATSTPTRCSA